MFELTVSRLWRYLQEPPLYVAAPLLGAFVGGAIFGFSLAAEWTR